MAKTYEAYKDSGIAWIGEIPSGWNVKRLGNFYNPRNEKVSDRDYAPLSVTMNGIVPQLDTAAKTNDGDNRKLVLKGDFAINSRSDRRGSCGISAYDGSVSLINIVLSPKGKINADYYNWLFHTSMFADEYYKWGHGIVDDLWTTRWSEMKNIDVVVPPISEQQAIASFLDKKCSEIDSLIALQEEMIVELQAYKQSVITEAVTKGLDHNIKMKDSGVEWIGDVPQHWEVARLKFYISIKSGDAIRNEDINENEWQNPVYGGGEIIGYTSDYNVDGQTIIIGRVGARCGCVTLIKTKAWASDNALVMKTTQLYIYMTYLLIAANLNSLNISNAQPLITATKVKNMSCCIPPLSEQQAIATYLDTKTSQIDSLIAIKQEKIAELKDYKKSIIYEYVTGKKKV